jgi:RND family efflux transporter MFP subunit
MQVQTAVSETLYKHIRPGQNVMLELDDQEKALSARVASLSPAADPMTHTYTIKLDVSAPGLKSGAFARVLFPSGQRTVLRVPASAILDRAGIPGVFVVDAKNVAQYRMVRPGKVEDGQVEVLSGLNPGERVVTGNAQAVNNGDKISG